MKRASQPMACAAGCEILRNGCHYAALSDRGVVRAWNGDAWAANPHLGFYLVAHGMGGHNAGGVASNAVVEALPAMVRAHLDLERNLRDPAVATSFAEIVARLSSGLREQAAADPELEGMGATLVAALVKEEAALIAHMGDCRAYLLHGACLNRLTDDHALAEMLVVTGELGAHEEAHPSHRPPLTRYMGMADEVLPDTRVVALEPGDELLLCTDGLTGMVPEERIRETLQAGDSLDATCAGLVAMANAAGGPDNITVLLVRRD